MKNKITSIFKRMFAVAISAVMLLGAIPMAASAVDIADSYSIGNTVYYNIDSPNFNNKVQFLRDVLAGTVPTYNYLEYGVGEESLAEMWQTLGYAIQDIHGQGTNTSKFKDQFDNVMAFGTAVYRDLNAVEGNYTNGDNDYDVNATGLVYANSVKAAEYAMRNAVYRGYKDAGGDRNSGDAVSTNTTLSDDSTTDDVYYMLCGAYKTSGDNKKGHYQALGMLFSDFKISTIFPSDNNGFYDTVTSEPISGGEVYAAMVENDTALATTASQSLTDSSSVTAKSTISGSSSYSFEESLSVEAGFSFPGGSLSTTVGFTASQAVEKGWSEDKGAEESKSVSRTVDIELPAYTSALITQEESTTTRTTNYQCPVAVTFRVTFVEYTLDPSSNDADPKTKILAEFGANATEDLYDRAVVNVGISGYDKNSINWKSVMNFQRFPFFSSGETLAGKINDYLAKYVPMSQTGATFTVEYKTVTSKVSALYPLHALKNVRLEDTSDSNISMRPGDTLDLSTIAVNGYNSKNALYYGFDGAKGTWAVVDANGNEINNSDIATVTVDKVSGKPILTAGNGSGTVYVKYKINENVYSTAAQPNVFTKNDQLDNTAIIMVNVSANSYNMTVDGVQSTYAVGTEVQLTANRFELDEEGKYAYAFESWTVEGAELSEAVGLNAVIVMPSNDVTVTTERYLFGDVNNDGKVNALDKVAVTKLIKASEKNHRADTNFDGKINALDKVNVTKVIKGTYDYGN